MSPGSAPLRREIVPDGPFTLRGAAEFGFGPTERRAPAYDGAMRMAFAVDGGRGHAGAVLRQPDPAGPVEVELWLRGGAEPDAALAQVARVVSLDYDGREFARIGERDPVIGALQREHPGQRPVLFHSPYEAAAWAIVSARRPSAQAARVRDALAVELGETFELDGRTLHAFPQPERLAGLGDAMDGLTPEKVTRLHGVADAALAGRLDVAHLHELGPQAAHAEVQTLKGLGPFYAGLVVLRASGFADALLDLAEPKVLAHTAQFYALGTTPSAEQFAQLAESWRPFRTWCMVLLRFGGDRAFGPGRTGPRRGA